MFIMSLFFSLTYKNPSPCDNLCGTEGTVEWIPVPCPSSYLWTKHPEGEKKVFFSGAASLRKQGAIWWTAHEQDGQRCCLFFLVPMTTSWSSAVRERRCYLVRQHEWAGTPVQPSPLDSLLESPVHPITTGPSLQASPSKAYTSPLPSPSVFLGLLAT